LAVAVSEGDVEGLAKVLMEELDVESKEAEALAHTLIAMAYAMAPPSPDDGTLCRVCKVVVGLLLG